MSATFLARGESRAAFSLMPLDVAASHDAEQLSLRVGDDQCPDLVAGQAGGEVLDGCVRSDRRGPWLDQRRDARRPVGETGTAHAPKHDPAG
jgi:hypothetical protein